MKYKDLFLATTALLALTACSSDSQTSGGEELPVELKLELAERLEGIYEAGWRHFLCGMALGCDMYFAEAVLQLRAEHPDVTLEAVIPCGSQPDRWGIAQRQRYNRLLDACDSVNVLQIHYTPDCMQKRNRYMVDHSSLLLACYTGYSGGTQSTLLYAERQGIQTLVIEIETV